LSTVGKLLPEKSGARYGETKEIKVIVTNNIAFQTTNLEMTIKIHIST